MTSNAVLVALEEQLVCYQRLARLAELQHEHVQRSDTDALLEVLAMRQEVLNQVAALENAMAPTKRRWSEYLDELEPDARAGAESLLAKTRELLERITTSDRNDALVLQQRKLNLGKQINQAAAARQVNRTYAAAAYGTKESTLDLKGM